MLNVYQCIRRLSAVGGVVTGVPCSGLAALIAGWEASKRWQHIPAVNESEAIGLAAGASVRQRTFVYLQNSGLGYALDGLTSLVIPAHHPITLIISHRGLTKHDALPQHSIAGGITIPVVESLKTPYSTCYKSSPTAFNSAVDALPPDRPSILIIAPDLKWQGSARSRVRRIMHPWSNPPAPSACTPTMRRFEQSSVISAMLKRITDEVVVSSTGYISRYVFALKDRHRNVYLTGAMGLTASFALGVEAAYRHKPGVVVIEGDGSALMHLGSFATVSAFGGSRYKHVVIDNNAYASTGGQPSSARYVSFSRIASAAGYRATANAADFRSVEDAVDWLFGVSGPALLEVDVDVARDQVPRVSVHPLEQMQRLRRSLQQIADD